MNTRQFELNGTLRQVCAEGRIHEAYKAWDAYLRPWLRQPEGDVKPTQPFEETVAAHAG